MHLAVYTGARWLEPGIVVRRQTVYDKAYWPLVTASENRLQIFEWVYVHIYTLLWTSLEAFADKHILLGKFIFSKSKSRKMKSIWVWRLTHL